MLYTDIIERLAEIGGIDCIGTPSEVSPSAICFAGVKNIKKYADGNKKVSLIFQISEMDIYNNQKKLVDRLTEKGRVLISSSPEFEGAGNPKLSIASLPVPTVNDGKYWIYSMIIEMTFYTKELI